MALSFNYEGAATFQPKKKSKPLEGGHLAGLVGDYYVNDGADSGDQFSQAIQKLGQRMSNPESVALKRPILPPSEWLKDPYYSGPLWREFWPQKRLDFPVAAQGDVTEIILTGAIGTGKTALVKAVCMYDLYRLSCFENPQKALGISQAETILFVMISLNQTKAKAKLYTPLRNAIKLTPYFRDEFPFDLNTLSSMEFPSNVKVIPGTTSEGAVHSEDVVFLAVSEANFLPVVTDSRKKRAGETLDVAAELVEATLRRMRSRFQQSNGQLPLCRMILDSSRQYPDDYVERRLVANTAGEIQHKVEVIDRSQWQAKAGVRDASGELIYGKDTFAVELGAANRFSKILDPEDEQFATGRIIRVPVELRGVFEADIEGSLRDYAGEAVLTLHPLITDRSALFSCVRQEEDDRYDISECYHPFSATSTTLKDKVRFLEEVLSIDGRPRVRPSHPRTLHVDVGITGDALGIAMGHVEDVVTINRGRDGADLDLPCMTCRGEKVLTCMRCGGTGYRKIGGTRVRCHGCMSKKTIECPACLGTGKYGVPVQRPMVYIDFLLQVTPPDGGQIQFDDVEALIERLRNNCGYRIPVITADGYESTQFLQRQMSRYGAVLAEHLSMDKSKDAYHALRNAVMDMSNGKRRLSFYDYSVLLRELTKVEDRPAKIDHPHRGSKDVADAAAGVVWNCERFPALQASGEGASIRLTEL